MISGLRPIPRYFLDAKMRFHSQRCWRKTTKGGPIVGIALMGQDPRGGGTVFSRDWVFADRMAPVNTAVDMSAALTSHHRIAEHESER